MHDERGADLYLVTGASAGIGRAVASELASRGLDVTAVARSADQLHTLATDANGCVAPIVADLATEEGVATVAAALAGHGDIAGIVHAAASLIPIEPYRSIVATELSDHFKIHVAAPLALCQALSLNNSVGRMLFIDSYSASTPRVGWSAYSIIKAAAQMAARAASAELDDTEVIRVYPGAVNTQVLHAVLGSDSPSAAVYGQMLARGEVAEAADAAGFIAALLVDVESQVLSTREVWDYNDPKDRALVG